MNLEADLERIIRQQFDLHEIHYERELDVTSLAARYLEMSNRRVTPTPRMVHSSEEMNDSLGKLLEEANPLRLELAKEAHETVFAIEQFFKGGENVNCFQSKGIQYATGKPSRDGLLWDYGMRHFHLRLGVEPSGFARRSEFLLFAIVTVDSAYFVDVRRHPQLHDLGWVRQDLLRIALSNWPELVEGHVLRGVRPPGLADHQKQELRRKNINSVAEFDGRAIMPLGGGTMADGSSLVCRMWAMRLLHEIALHQGYFESEPQEVVSALESKGNPKEMNLELALLDSLDLSVNVISSLGQANCLSRELSAMGFTVVEPPMRRPIVVTLGHAVSQH